MNSVSPEEQRRRRVFAGKCQEVGGEGWEGWVPKDGAQVGLGSEKPEGGLCWEPQLVLPPPQ